ncbi:hypothetical protein NOV18_08645 [Pseudomonas asiatica]|uniref:Uncharacterized protein n=1 Tax=Pseudomonas asiatica TaxID=2219225 RepID=A0AAJ5LEC6_9PSED|nr:hypothetical protein [Pseudomonas asiatica]UUC20532.1 hypothetical protein NOV18_08645 [Pseudomonas asiatica]
MATFSLQKAVALTRASLTELKHQPQRKRESKMSNQTSARFKEIYRPGCFYYGGAMFRATSNGITVNIQRKADGSNTFKTMRRVTQEEWDIFFDKNHLSEPAFRDRSGIIAGYAGGRN